jgi:hypothetical protein
VIASQIAETGKALLKSDRRPNKFSGRELVRGASRFKNAQVVNPYRSFGTLAKGL